MHRWHGRSSPVLHQLCRVGMEWVTRLGYDGKIIFCATLLDQRTSTYRTLNELADKQSKPVAPSFVAAVTDLWNSTPISVPIHSRHRLSLRQIIHCAPRHRPNYDRHYDPKGIATHLWRSPSSSHVKINAQGSSRPQAGTISICRTPPPTFNRNRGSIRVCLARPGV